MRKAEPCSNTTCGLGLLLFFPFNFPSLHLSPSVQGGGDLSALWVGLEQRHPVVASDWFSMSGDSLSSTLERSERMTPVCVCVLDGSETVFFFLHSRKRANFPPSVSGCSEPPLCD